MPNPVGFGGSPRWSDAIDGSLTSIAHECAEPSTPEAGQTGGKRSVGAAWTPPIPRYPPPWPEGIEYGGNARAHRLSVLDSITGEPPVEGYTYGARGFPRPLSMSAHRCLLATERPRLLSVLPPFRGYSSGCPIDDQPETTPCTYLAHGTPYRTPKYGLVDGSDRILSGKPTPVRTYPRRQALWREYAFLPKACGPAKLITVTKV